MSDKPVVSSRTADGLSVIETDAPPLNLLSAAVRSGLYRELQAAASDPGVEGVLLTCRGETAFSGADIREFESGVSEPDLPTLIDAIAGFPKPITIALHGRVLGGGLELALAAQARIAAPGTHMGLPEIRLGLAPGCGGIERVTQLGGVDAALDLCVLGREMTAEQMLDLDLVDAVATGDLTADAMELARNPSPRRKPRLDPDAEDRIASFKARNRFRLRGQSAPDEIMHVIARAAEDPEVLRLNLGEAAFHRLEVGPQSHALRHLFKAERQVRELPFLPEGTAPLAVSKVGIVGAGTMGSGIATAFLARGYQVILHDQSAETLARAPDVIRTNLQGAVRRGKMTESGAEQAQGRLMPAPALDALSAADLIIEAVYEDMTIKKEIFAQLDRIARPGAILATNTSFLDIDEIARSTTRPDHVVGMHFFSPAHVMRLLEVVRGTQTAARITATAMAIGKRIGKIAVCVKNCHGFVGNRILLRRQDAAMELLLAGVCPYDIDRAMVDFGMPMGPFAMADLAGLDVGWDRQNSAARTISEVMCETGRLGRKSGHGYYDYDERGQAQPSSDALALIADFRKRAGRAGSPTMNQAEILDRLLAPMLEEAGAIIDEGVVLRPSDIDVIWVHGYGWPAWRGGPVWWRDHASVIDDPSLS